MPHAKATVPLIFWRREKKAMVFWSPMMRVKPIRKRIWIQGQVRLGETGRQAS